MVYFEVEKKDSIINSPYNTRQDQFEDRVVRGSILSADGQTLAYTQVNEDDTETRIYPFNNLFAHIVGYDSNGKNGDVTIFRCPKYFRQKRSGFTGIRLRRIRE